MSNAVVSGDAILPTVAKIPRARLEPRSIGKFAKQCDDACTGLGKKLAIHRYREGQALKLAKVKVSRGGGENS